MRANKSSKAASGSVEFTRTFNPHRHAMLQALRVVLDSPRKPIVLKEEVSERLAILPEKSDVCTLTARTPA